MAARNFLRRGGWRWTRAVFILVLSVSPRPVLSSLPALQLSIYCTISTDFILYLFLSFFRVSVYYIFSVSSKFVNFVMFPIFHLLPIFLLSVICLCDNNIPVSSFSCLPAWLSKCLTASGKSDNLYQLEWI